MYKKSFSALESISKPHFIIEDGPMIASRIIEHRPENYSTLTEYDFSLLMYQKEMELVNAYSETIEDLQFALKYEGEGGIIISLTELDDLFPVSESGQTFSWIHRDGSIIHFYQERDNSGSGRFSIKVNAGETESVYTDILILTFAGSGSTMVFSKDWDELLDIGIDMQDILSWLSETYATHLVMAKAAMLAASVNISVDSLNQSLAAMSQGLTGSAREIWSGLTNLGSSISNSSVITYLTGIWSEVSDLYRSLSPDAVQINLRNVSIITSSWLGAIVKGAVATVAGIAGSILVMAGSTIPVILGVLSIGLSLAINTVNAAVNAVTTPTINGLSTDNSLLNPIYSGSVQWTTIQSSAVFSTLGIPAEPGQLYKLSGHGLILYFIRSISDTCFMVMLVQCDANVYSSEPFLISNGSGWKEMGPYVQNWESQHNWSIGWRKPISSSAISFSEPGWPIDGIKPSPVGETIDSASWVEYLRPFGMLGTSINKDLPDTAINRICFYNLQRALLPLINVILWSFSERRQVSSYPYLATEGALTLQNGTSEEVASNNASDYTYRSLHAASTLLAVTEPKTLADYGYELGDIYCYDSDAISAYQVQGEWGDTVKVGWDQMVYDRLICHLFQLYNWNNSVWGSLFNDGTSVRNPKPSTYCSETDFWLYVTNILIPDIAFALNQPYVTPAGTSTFAALFFQQYLFSSAFRSLFSNVLTMSAMSLPHVTPPSTTEGSIKRGMVTIGAVAVVAAAGFVAWTKVVKPKFSQLGHDRAKALSDQSRAYDEMPSETPAQKQAKSAAWKKLYKNTRKYNRLGSLLGWSPLSLNPGSGVTYSPMLGYMAASIDELAGLDETVSGASDTIINELVSQNELSFRAIADAMKSGNWDDLQ